LNGTSSKHRVAIVVRFCTHINPVVADIACKASATGANKRGWYIDTVAAIVARTSLALVDIYGAVFSLIPCLQTVAIVAIHTIGAHPLETRTRCTLIHIYITT
jgi:hypothetical protein